MTQCGLYKAISMIKDVKERDGDSKTFWCCCDQLELKETKQSPSSLEIGISKCSVDKEPSKSKHFKATTFSETTA